MSTVALPVAMRAADLRPGDVIDYDAVEHLVTRVALSPTAEVMLELWQREAVEHLTVFLPADRPIARSTPWTAR
jgi:hypothetical protein